MALESEIRQRMDDLTAAERKVATAMLADYPFAGLLTLAELAKRARASSQSILRLVTKLGFKGYGEFQRAVIGEIKEGYHSPVILHETSDQQGADNVSLSKLTKATVAAVQETIQAMPEKQFRTICELMADPKRSVFLIGGRISHTIAMFLFRHLRQIRPKVYLVSEDEEEWPEYLLRMGRKDIVLVIDYRRYQSNLERFAEMATQDRGARIILFTDKWFSPVSKFSDYTLPAAVDVGTPWDTSLPLLLIVEAIINRVSEQDWDATRKRIGLWDGLRVTAPSSAGAHSEKPVNIISEGDSDES